MYPKQPVFFHCSNVGNPSTWKVGPIGVVGVDVQERSESKLCTYMAYSNSTCVPESKLPMLGMVIPPLVGILIVGT